MAAAFRDDLAEHIRRVDPSNRMTATNLAEEIVWFARTNSPEMLGYQMGPAVENELFDFVHRKVAGSAIGGDALADAVVDEFHLR